MKYFWTSILALLLIGPCLLSGQSLYQDSRKLTDILRQHQPNAEFELKPSHAIRLQAIKERKGMHYFQGNNEFTLQDSSIILEPERNYLFAGLLPGDVVIARSFSYKEKRKAPSERRIMKEKRFILSQGGRLMVSLREDSVEDGYYTKGFFELSDINGKIGLPISYFYRLDLWELTFEPGAGRQGNIPYFVLPKEFQSPEKLLEPLTENRLPLLQEGSYFIEGLALGDSLYLMEGNDPQLVCYLTAARQIKIHSFLIDSSIERPYHNLIRFDNYLEEVHISSNHSENGLRQALLGTTSFAERKLVLRPRATPQSQVSLQKQDADGNWNQVPFIGNQRQLDTLPYRVRGVNPSTDLFYLYQGDKRINKRPIRSKDHVNLQYEAGPGNIHLRYLVPNRADRVLTLPINDSLNILQKKLRALPSTDPNHRKIFEKLDLSIIPILSAKGMLPINEIYQNRSMWPTELDDWVRDRANISLFYSTKLYPLAFHFLGVNGLDEDFQPMDRFVIQSDRDDELRPLGLETRGKLNVFRVQGDQYIPWPLDSAAGPWVQGVFQSTMPAFNKKQHYRMAFYPSEMEYEDFAYFEVLLSDPAGLPLSFLVPNPKVDSLVVDMFTFNDRIELYYPVPFIEKSEVIRTRDVRELTTILGTHGAITEEKLQAEHLWRELSLDYRQNPFLGELLTPFLASNRLRLGLATQYTEDEGLAEAIRQIHRAYYPWQLILYQGRQLVLERKVSLKDVANTYRQPIPTALDKLEQASEQFDSEKRLFQDGLSTATLVAGLSDFIVERAQEELNITFLDRLKQDILQDTTEFAVLFPSTKKMLGGFEITQYRSLINYARTAFLTDLDNLSLNFPRLLQLPKYQSLNNDPTVYNIFLVYDLANKVYEGTPVDTVMLHLFGRLDERQTSVTQEINKSLGGYLNRNPDKRTLLIEQFNSYVQTVDQYDNTLREVSQELELVFDSLQKITDSEAQKESIKAVQQDLANSLTTPLISGSPRALESLRLQQALSTNGIDSLPPIFQLQQEGEDWDLTAQREYLLRTFEMDKEPKWLKQKLLTQSFLAGDPAYWYVHHTLPLSEFAQYYGDPRPDTLVIAAGLDLLRQSLRSQSARERSQDLELVREGLRYGKNSLFRIDSIRAENSYDLKAYRSIMRLLEEFIALNQLYNQRLTEQMSIWKRNQTQYGLSPHDISALDYLGRQAGIQVDSFDIPTQNLTIEFASIGKLIEVYMKSLFEQPSTFEKWALISQIKEEGSFEALKRANAQQHVIIDQTLAHVLQVQNRYPKSPDSLYTLWQDFQTKTQRQKLVKEELEAIDRPARPSPEEYLTRRLNQLEEEVLNLNQQLDSIVVKAQRIESFVQDSLEAIHAEKLYRTRNHAREFSDLVELTINWLDALRSGSLGVDSIIRYDTLIQSVSVRHPKGMVITYDSVVVRRTSIASGKGVRKWMTRQQFSEMMEDSLSRQVFLGLLYQRLSHTVVDADFNYEGLALTSTKLVNAIYQLDEEREKLKLKRQTNQALNFKDYYPFLRTSIDLINITLNTPMLEGKVNLSPADTLSKVGRLVYKFRTLGKLSDISDESLSLFEHIFAKDYGNAIRNAVNLLSIIQGVSLEEAKALYVAQNQEILEKAKDPAQLVDKEVKDQVNSQQSLSSALLVYGSFMANIVSAQNADEVKGALKAVAVPPGSSSVKRSAEYNISLNSYFGGGFYIETLLNTNMTGTATRNLSLAVPIGISLSAGGLGKRHQTGLSIFVPILDIGTVTSFRIDRNNAGLGNALPDLTLSNLIAPGAYLVLNLPRSPFSVGLGAQYGPQARQVTVGGVQTSARAWRLGTTFTIDVPIFNFYNQ